MEHLWTWDIATSEEKQLTHGEFTVSDARWSPDGARITFTSNPTPLADDSSLQTAWVLDAAAGKQRKLVETKDATHTARWSPDGKSVAYLSTAGDVIYQQNLFVVSADEGAPRKLMGAFELNAEEPLWAQDGKTIYFSTRITNRRSVRRGRRHRNRPSLDGQARRASPHGTQREDRHRRRHLVRSQASR